MKQIDAYYLALGESARLKKNGDLMGLLVVLTRPRVLQICARFCQEVFDVRDISPFLDRIMEDLGRPDQDVNEISFDSSDPSGKRF